MTDGTLINPLARRQTYRPVCHRPDQTWRLGKPAHEKDLERQRPEISGRCLGKVFVSLR